MKTQNYSKQKLISLLKELELKVGGMPKKKQWIEDLDTPSDMPIRMLFGNWTSFLKEAGYTPRKSEFSIQARNNSILARKGSIGGNNKGGRFKDKSGYIQVWMPSHPNARIAGYIHEHRLVMSNFLGRPLNTFENIHHKDGDRSNNDLSNLELWDKTQPSGQRVEDKIKWAIEFLIRHNYQTPELINN